MSLARLVNIGRGSGSACRHTLPTTSPFVSLPRANSSADLDRLAEVEVIYETLPGWESDISEITDFDKLPANCQKYVHFIEDFLGVKVQWIGVGPARESTIKVF